MILCDECGSALSEFSDRCSQCGFANIGEVLDSINRGFQVGESITVRIPDIYRSPGDRRTHPAIVASRTDIKLNLLRQIQNGGDISSYKFHGDFVFYWYENENDGRRTLGASRSSWIV